MDRPGISLTMKLFVDQLDERLKQLEVADIKVLLTARGARMLPAERAAVLELLAPVDAALDEGELPAQSGSALVAEVRAFVGELETGSYCDGWGWNPETRRQEYLGDDSWILRVDALFDGAAEAFLRGDFEIAADAYGVLLGAFRLPNAFTGERPELEIETDIGEAKARYFRCLFEVLPAEAAATRVCEAVNELRYIGSDRIGLHAVSDTLTTPLGRLDAILPAWIRTLVRLGELHPGRRIHSREWLLAEAARLSGGLTTLGEMARLHGPHSPELFSIWLSDLIEQGRFEEAAVAGREAVAATVHGFQRHRLASLLALVERYLGNSVGAAEAREAAFGAQPSVRTLRLLLAELGPTAKDLRPLATRLLALVPDEESANRAELLVWLRGIAGQWEEEVRWLLQSGPQDWVYGNGFKARSAVLLLAALGEAEPGPDSAIADYLKGASSYHYCVDDRLGLNPREATVGAPNRAAVNDLLRPAIRQAGGDAGEEATVLFCRQSPPIFHWFVKSLSICPLADGKRAQCLILTERLAELRAASRLFAQQRGVYDSAASFVAASAELFALDGDARHAAGILRSSRGTFSRWTSYTRRLQEYCASSPWLPDELPTARAAAPLNKARLNGLRRALKRERPLSADTVECTAVARRLDRRSATGCATPIASLRLSVRTCNCLEGEGILTVDDLVTENARGLLAIRNVGRTTLKEVRKALAAKGLVLSDE